MSEPVSIGARAVFCLCAAEVLTMVGVFAFPALLPAFMTEWGLSNTEAGWISGVLFAGYTMAVPVLTTLTDRIDARKVYLAGALVAGLSCLLYAVAAQGFWSAMALRFAAGVGLAGTYMPGLKALVDRTSGAQQARWISFYTASFSLGTSGSFMIVGLVAELWGWKAAFALAGACALAAATLILALLEKAEPTPPVQPVNPFDFAPVFRNRAAMGYVLGYAAHVWELFGARSWMVAFLAWVLAAQPGAAGPSPTATATIAALLAMVSSVVGADLAIRFDRRRVCAAAMLSSAAMAAVIGFLGGMPYGVVVGLMLLYNVLIQIDSAALTTGAVMAAHPGPPRRHHRHPLPAGLRRRLRRAAGLRHGAGPGRRRQFLPGLGPRLRLAGRGGGIGTAGVAAQITRRIITPDSPAR
ncbi:major facilitator superfamily permease [Paramagnetospirillum caucaseum]|uniref:Major facilitator superfamily permease n=1 Tax=Paramagnetospirillum caucaseum TaxID=1244869 RepID=M2Y6K9_9PROT|nr:MFS transporter [Paramagnetospirillum caucaseum]EME68681.1 major facilitator superfamily permease [Paramagnetospirillum caucaseum]